MDIGTKVKVVVTDSVFYGDVGFIEDRGMWHEWFVNFDGLVVAFDTYELEIINELD